MRSQKKSVTAWLSSNHYRLVAVIGLIITMLCICCDANAGKDLLANTMGDVKETLNGTGKKWIVMIDAAISLGAFAMTKKPFVFFSTLGVLLAISAIGIIIA